MTPVHHGHVDGSQSSSQQITCPRLAVTRYEQQSGASETDMIGMLGPQSPTQADYMT